MIKIKFSERLKEQREYKGLSQGQLAKEIGVQQSAVSKWELRNVEPDYSTLANLAKYFDVTVGYLLGTED